MGTRLGFMISAKSRERTWKGLEPGPDIRFEFVCLKDNSGYGTENGLSGGKC